VREVPRPFSTVTVLGRVMSRRHLSVQQVSVSTGINARMLSDFLAARRRPLAWQVARLSALLEMDAEDLFDGDGWRLAGEVEAPAS
jgi:hypothetical protein